MSGLFLLLSCFVEISELNANSVDPDQMPRSAAADLGLHCLPVFLLWDARLIWVKQVLLVRNISLYFQKALNYKFMIGLHMGPVPQS